MTNFERIKAMSVEELAEFLESAIDEECWCCAYKHKHCHNIDCKTGYIEWLESEVETE